MKTKESKEPTFDGGFDPLARLDCRRDVVGDISSTLQRLSPPCGQGFLKGMGVVTRQLEGRETLRG